jgi:hypothetical protein
MEKNCQVAKNAEDERFCFSWCLGVEEQFSADGATTRRF